MVFDLALNSVLVLNTKKEQKKSRLYGNPAILPEFYSGAKPNSPLLRRDSNMVLQMPLPIWQNRDFHKAGLASDFLAY